MKSILILPFLCLTALAFGQSKENRQHIGDSLMARGLHDEHVRYLEQQLALYPRNEEILRELGHLHIWLNHPDAGEKYYREALEVNPGCAKCYLNLGRAYGLRQEYREAMEMVEKALQTGPPIADMYFFRGMLKEESGDMKGAMADYTQTIRLDSTNGEFWVQRGHLYEKQGLFWMAIADLNKAVSLSPQTPALYRARAEAYFNKRKFPEALADMNQAVALDSAEAAFFLGRGAVWFALNEPAKALADYTRSISLNGDDFTGYVNRASTYYKLEDLDASCADYRYLAPLVANGTITDPQSVKEIREALPGFCDSARASYYFQRGVACYNLGHYQDAITVYRKGLEKFPQSVFMLSFMGNAWLTLGEYDKAIACYLQSLERKDHFAEEIAENPSFTTATAIKTFEQGNLASVYASLAECYLYSNQHEKALTAINEALSKIPDDPKFNKEAYYCIRGCIMLAMNRPRDAKEDFDRSIQINSNFTSAYLCRAIANISLTEGVTVHHLTFRNNMQYSFGWAFPGNTRQAHTQFALISALTDCDLAIEIDHTLGLAWYARAQIKRTLGQADACFDFVTARRLGMEVEAEILEECR